jgi:cytoskeletal protein CcmA (bactofilin family)
MAKPIITEAPSINIIGQSTSIEGVLICSGDIRIEGSLKGTIDCKGKVVIGETGFVEGSITCRNADFSGKIKADVTVIELLVLKSTVIIDGDITIGKLAIEPGAQFKGKCSMEIPPFPTEV